MGQHLLAIREHMPAEKNLHLEHVEDEMLEYNLQNYVNLGNDFNIIWRPHKPEIVFEASSKTS